MGGETVSLEQFGECEGQRGGGGKLRKSTFRKKQPTPYARPEESQRRRWMSKLVDPAFRLISGGAARLLPSFFGSSSFPDVDSGEDRDKLAVELKQNDNGRAEDDTLEHIAHTSLPIVSIRSNKEANRLENMSKLDQIREEKYKALSNDMGLTEIEQLMMGKQFSRDEADNLIKILQSKAVDHQEPPVMAPRDSKGIAATHGIDEVPIEEKKENYNRSIMGPSTPHFQPTILDDVGASPIEIARAYMGTRTSDTLPSKIWASGVERTSFRANTSASDAFISSPAPNSSTCWPGSMAQNQLNYSTPYNERDRYGLHNFPRTPYSRTIYSKPKSKLTQSQREDDKFFKASSAFGLQLRISSTHESAKSSKDVSADAGGSVGPIRRLHHKSIAGSSLRQPPYIQSSPFSQQAEFSSISKGTFPVIKNNVESGEMSSVTEFQSRDRTIHSHSSQIAQTILEHLNRHPPTPKEKEEEIRRAISWKRSESSLPNESLPKQSRSQSLILGVSDANNSSIEANQNDSTQSNCNHGQSFFIKNTASTSDTNGDNVKDRDNSSFKIRNSSEDVPKTRPVSTKPLAQSSGSKPVLPSINIDRNSSKNMFSSESSSAFTFPVSESAGALFELPTPSFVPSISTILPPSSASAQPQLKPESAVPSYSFGSNRSSPPLVFSFPSSTNLAMENNDASDIKFSFGSDNKERLLFGGMGKDTICC